jgi:hypothetical protein
MASSISVATTDELKKEDNNNNNNESSLIDMSKNILTKIN